MRIGSRKRQFLKELETAGDSFIKIVLKTGPNSIFLKLLPKFCFVFKTFLVLKLSQKSFYKNSNEQKIFYL